MDAKRVEQEMTMKKPIRSLMVLAAAALTPLVWAVGAQAAPKKLNLDNPTDAMAAYRKVQCSRVDGEPVVYHWMGEVYSRVEGEPDKHLFNLQGMNIRQCVSVVDPVRGKGFRQVSRELMFYTDKKTGEILRTWDNPWTGKTVDVVHVANDPVNMRSPIFEASADGKPFKMPVRVQNGRVFMPSVVPLWYTNPMAGEYQDYVGNQYHSMEIFDFVVDEADLLDASKPRANPSIAWVRMSPWLPFMEMTGRNGILVFNAVGQTLPGGIKDLPRVITDEIAARYPIYTAPPPGDDARPNETSWTYFKKLADAKRAAAKK
jgi:hypothetical protein